ncbi:hypothetical protein [Halalkalirubrum salinum]|uniref:hypothetical protein n=1 Tax=Halalkalirubrum salinum TaxID=2563889 RepID=UPI0010FBAC3D|nr:hypothetical protein [Halalkalirubrum salinum]
MFGVSRRRENHEHGFETLLAGFDSTIDPRRYRDDRPCGDLVCCLTFTNDSMAGLDDDRQSPTAEAL